MKILWEGPFFRPLSLDKVNRSLATGLARMGHEVWVTGDTVSSTHGGEDRVLIQSMMTQPIPVDVHVKHAWPPSITDRSGDLVLYAPWEYGAVPDDWIAPMRYRTRKVVVYSDAVKEMFLASGMPEDHLAVIPLGVDVGMFHPGGPVASIAYAKTRVILWVGGLIPRKGVDLLLDAYRRAFSPDDDVSLVLKVSGQGVVYDDPTLPQQVLDFQQDPRNPHLLVLNEDFSEPVLASLYRRADLVVSPYRGEGFNLPVLEAMACGAVVATSDTNPTNEFFSGVSGFRIPGHRREFEVEYTTQLGWEFEPDVEALAEILRRGVSLDTVQRVQMSGVAVAEARQFTWEKSVMAWNTLLTDLIPRETVLSPAVILGGAKPQASIVWRGPVRNASGYASETRDLLVALSQTDVIPRLVGLDGENHVIATPQEEALFQTLEGLTVADTAPLITNTPGHGATRKPRSLAIARTTFETDRMPASWKPLLATMDDVWVPTEWNRQTFMASGHPPDRIHVIPGTVNTDLFVPSTGPRFSQRLEFCSVLDWSDRKGWDVLIKAWANAFRASDPVRLRLKVSRIVDPSSDPLKKIQETLSRMGRTWDSCATIEIIDELWTPAQLVEFYQQSDLFVLPTRGEGWGRPITEAMACGIPVMVTHWSAPTSYVNDTNGWLIPVHRMQKISSSYPVAFYRGHKWADPDPRALTELLREAVNRAADLPRMGMAARQQALQFHPSVIADAVITRLRALGAI